MVEALVVGAGPAGSVAATVLARQGVRVLLVDRARFPREKLCGDTVNPGTVALFESLGLARTALAHGLVIRGMWVTGAGGVRVRGPYAKGLTGRALPRRALDQALVDEAVAAGARFQDGVAVVGALLDDRSSHPVVRGVVLRLPNGRQLRVPAGITIAADGRRSTLAFQLGLARHPARPRRWVASAYFAGVAGLEPYGEMHIRPTHYLGVAPVPGGLANVCLVSADRAPFRRPEELVAQAVAADPLLRPRFAAAERVTPVASMGPLAVDADQAGCPGLLLAGDAAGFVDPMTGDGLRFAVRGGMLAADAAYAELETPTGRAHLTLGERRRREFAWKWRFNRAVRALVASGSGVRIGAAGARLAPAALRGLVAYAGDC